MLEPWAIFVVPHRKENLPRCTLLGMSKWMKKCNEFIRLSYYYEFIVFDIDEV